MIRPFKIGCSRIAGRQIVSDYVNKVYPSMSVHLFVCLFVFTAAVVKGYEVIWKHWKGCLRTPASILYLIQSIQNNFPTKKNEKTFVKI